MMTGEEGLQNVNDHLSHQSDIFTNLVCVGGGGGGGGGQICNKWVQLLQYCIDCLFLI